MLRQYFPKVPSGYVIVVTTLTPILIKITKIKEKKKHLLPQFTINLLFLKKCFTQLKLAHGSMSWAMKEKWGHCSNPIYFLVFIIQCYLKSKLPNFQAKANTVDFARQNACGEMSQFIQNSKLSLVSDIFMKIHGWIEFYKNSFLLLGKICPGKISRI